MDLVDKVWVYLGFYRLYILKKIITSLTFLVFASAYSQWEFRVNQEISTIEALGLIQFKDDRLVNSNLVVDKSRRMGLNISIQSSFIKENQKYYVLFELGEQKIKAKHSIVKNGSLRMEEFKNLIDNEVYELGDFLKILKAASQCTLTLRSSNKVIQGEIDLTGSTNAINFVLRGQYP